MKLNYRRTVLVGFAFLSICAFWQMYNSIVPLILTNTFHLDESVTGMIMAADNVVALFLLPLFGGISDRCRSKLGKRTPFLLFGTVAAVALMMLLPVLDNSYAQLPTTAKAVGFIVILGLLLIAMGTYRSPAVALMPDVTPKPLRSKANAVINLMGAVGGILYLLITSFLYSAKRTAGMTHINYFPLFVIVGGIMLAALAVILLTVREPKLAQEVAAYEAEHPEENITVRDENGKETLPRPVRRSLAFLLVSIALWFIGYNAVETWFTTYAVNRWGMATGEATLCLTVATGGAILAYLPVGIIASKVGRKRTILFGAGLLTACFAAAFVFTLFYGHFSPVLYVLFALVGIAWASINVNSLPMVVEMCKGSDVGKFTGYYYTFSMAAQIITPTVAGFLMKRIGYHTLFPYAAVFVAVSFVTMLFVRHGDSRPEAAKNLMKKFEED